ncbi:AraC family transcriptional regulator [Pseudonocardia abyssalis]|uniref:AraC family transcriptional regulator n=1 Tax=Pseudonocardia abyssalis TaxID=2792008 RepID=A0ABS6UVL2_9PSEU|nr:AraC family transcriptional regulator [Pseudonocardia abyssalis]MBW0114761.1 AraC family transcriptional regulator [Pseudonocardia abyssalis]MBW0136297.1 AraC family transcriptional regulator [Pseudonocardia abyssalis]
MQTSDLDEASAAISEAYAPHKLQIAGRSSRLDMRLWTNGMPGLDFGYIQLGTDVRLYAPPPGYYVVVFAGVGHVRVGSGKGSVVASRGRGVVVSPREPVFFEDWSQDCRLVTARFEPATLERVLASLLGRSLVAPLRFDLEMDLGAPRGGSFLRILQLLRSELDRRDGMTTDPVMAGGLARLAMSGLLRAQPHNYVDQLDDTRRVEPPASIRNALELIETKAAEIVSVTELATAAGLSVRALEDGFRRHVGRPPMAYLREFRLAQIHAELHASDPDQTTVSAVARRWGLNHYGRFTATYSARYGVGPAETLRRSSTTFL